jgi:N-acetyl-alpha-D-glucosaminyl L-malate synthase BshA
VHRRLDVSDLRSRLAVEPGTKVIIHISNFRPVKRVDAVVRIFDRVRREVPARLLLVGDGPDLPTAHRVARELGISHLVRALGAQEEVLSLLSASDVFLLPSAQESFGLAALEAMACEVPVVASRVGGLPEVIEHGVTGYLHPPDALEEMAASVLKLVTDPVHYREVGQAACRRVREHFCAERVVPMYEDFYRAVIKRGT